MVPFFINNNSLALPGKYEGKHKGKINGPSFSWHYDIITQGQNGCPMRQNNTSAICISQTEQLPPSCQVKHDGFAFPY